MGLIKTINKDILNKYKSFNTNIILNELIGGIPEDIIMKDLNLKNSGETLVIGYNGIYYPTNKTLEEVEVLLKSIKDSSNTHLDYKYSDEPYAKEVSSIGLYLLLMKISYSYRAPKYFKLISDEDIMINENIPLYYNLYTTNFIREEDYKYIINVKDPVIRRILIRDNSPFYQNNNYHEDKYNKDLFKRMLPYAGNILLNKIMSNRYLKYKDINITKYLELYQELAQDGLSVLATSFLDKVKVLAYYKEKCFSSVYDEKGNLTLSRDIISELYLNPLESRSESSKIASILALSFKGDRDSKYATEVIRLYYTGKDKLALDKLIEFYDLGNIKNIEETNYEVYKILLQIGYNLK